MQHLPQQSSKPLSASFSLPRPLAASAQNPGLDSKAVLIPASFVIMGLVLGLVGDIMLDFKIVIQTKSRHSDTYTWAGMAVFGIGHILYIAAVSMLYGFSWPAVWAGVILNTVIFLIRPAGHENGFWKMVYSQPFIRVPALHLLCAW